MFKRKCRIMHNLPVPLIGQEKQDSLFWQTVKAVGAVILVTLVLAEIWALTWFLCALDDVCYAANTGGL